jgi:hypothetical protein
MLNTLLALGLLLTTASQLRVRGSPIGLGEIILVSWSIFVIMRGWLLREFRISRAFCQLLMFWLLFTMSLGIGTINPNQLAELCGVLAAISIHLFDVATRLRGRITALMCMAAAIYTGFLTQSDTFRYAVVAAVSIYVFLKLGAKIKLPHASVALATVAGILLMFMKIIPQSEHMLTGDVVGVLSKEGGKQASAEAELRKTLWVGALDRGFFDSAMLGFGPGPHLMMPTEINTAHLEDGGQRPGETIQPQANGTANYEAHNTVLDLFTQGGILAAGSIVWLLSMGWRRASSLGFSGLMALLGAVGVFFLTGNVIRLPVIWFALVLCLVAERHTPRAVG